MLDSSSKLTISDLLKTKKQGRGGAWNVMDATEKTVDHAQTAKI